MYKFGDHNQPIYICPRCGDIIHACFAQNNGCSCEFGFDKYIKTNYTSGIYNQMNEQQRKEWEEMLRKRYVLTPDNPYYDKELYYQREDEDFEAELGDSSSSINTRQVNSTSSAALVCPKCGSTSFTPVRRKWSLLTGFMTNKVDMVCNGCGWVKKG